MEQIYFTNVLVNIRIFLVQIWSETVKTEKRFLIPGHYATDRLQKRPEYTTNMYA